MRIFILGIFGLGAIETTLLLLIICIIVIRKVIKKTKLSTKELNISSDVNNESINKYCKNGSLPQVLTEYTHKFIFEIGKNFMTIYACCCFNLYIIYVFIRREINKINKFSYKFVLSIFSISMYMFIYFNKK
jgi:hypothetical protein